MPLPWSPGGLRPIGCGPHDLYVYGNVAKVSPAAATQQPGPLLADRAGVGRGAWKGGPSGGPEPDIFRLHILGGKPRLDFLTAPLYGSVLALASHLKLH